MLKRIVIVCIVSLLMTGCGDKPDGICPYSIMVDGKTYYTYEEVVEATEVEVLGYITSYVHITQMPEEDNQSNFAECLEQPYGTMDGQMLIFYSDHWHKCYLPEEIDKK